MANVYKDATTGKWVAQVQTGFYANGRPKYKSFFDDVKKNALKRANEYIVETNNLSSVPEGEDILTGDYVHMYIDTYKKNKIKPSSLSRDYGICNNQIKKCIGGYSISKLTTSIIQQHMINALTNDGYSLSTIHKAYVLLNEALNKAVQENRILKNPCLGVTLPSKSVVKPKEIEILTDEEVQKFLEVASTDRYPNGLAISLVLYTGLRCGELCALTMSDIDLKRKIINVHKNISVGYVGSKRTLTVQEGTKTKPKREVPLNDKAVKIIKAVQKKYNLKSGDFFLYTMKDTIPDTSTIGCTYNNMLKYAGIEGKTGIHTLRHTFASALIKQGTDIKIVSEILGHSSVSFTYNTYIHLTSSQKFNAIKNLEY